MFFTVIKEKKYRWISVFILVCMLLSCFGVFTVGADSENNVYDLEAIENIMLDIIKAKKIDLYGDDDVSLLGDRLLENAGSSAADWYAFGIGRLGLKEDYELYLSVLRNYVSQKYQEIGGLDTRKATEWHRVSLTILALGGDPSKFGTDGEGNVINLIADGSYSRPEDARLAVQGTNAYIWALIALDSMRYKAPEGFRTDIITEILKRQLDNGAFSLDGKTEDVDITAMAIQALSPYVNSEEVLEFESGGELKSTSVREAVFAALSYLSEVQNEDGTFSTWGQATSESTASVITALCCLGIDPLNDDRFIKNENSILDGLMKFRTEDGGFLHLLSDSSVNSISGEQVLYSLIALYRYYCGYRSLFDFRPEQSEELKSQISALRSGIDELQNLDTEKQKESAKKLLEQYLSVPLGERSYVYNYYILAEVLKKAGIDYNTDGYIEGIGENDSGAGDVTDILGNSEDTYEVVFDKQDLDELRALPKTLSTEYYSTVIRLLSKLERATNRDEYLDELSELNEMKTEIEKIQTEIESINIEISEVVYPLEQIDKEKAEIIDDIYNRVLKLTEYDRQQITGYEDLLKARAKIASLRRKPYIFAAISIAIVLLVFILLRRMKKRRMEKRLPVSDE